VPQLIDRRIDRRSAVRDGIQQVAQPVLFDGGSPESNARNRGRLNDNTSGGHLRLHLIAE
jgi:hypothetical protein